MGGIIEHFSKFKTVGIVPVEEVEFVFVTIQHIQS